MLSGGVAPLGAAAAAAAARAAWPGACAGLAAALDGGGAAMQHQQQRQRRGVASSAATAAAAAPAAPSGSVLEVREYTLHPAGMKAYLKLTAEHAELRRSLLPFLGMFTCDTGGELNVVTHLYAYESMAAREAARAAAAKDAQWVAYVDAGRQYMQKQASRIMLEATGLYAATGAPGAAAFAPPSGAGPGMYELRQYQLHPGYGSVPKLLKAFEEGLPDKIAADPEGRLVSFAYSDVGTLNSVMELWRYPNAAACIRARQAARQVPKWRETIAAVTPGVQTFTTSFLTPCPFSPWQ
ncbi:hypothetical protein Rsub_12557 [Raphidocelis subcapitata]|uniref:NIPSNAP domain-containing protein n=1 Tax=Raphidocelis subcapitata TaxID=307507 RepID=A0A2V0PJ23_9CHLO|nr:hypothetical protein Rsub_12557 [Raphidocelis subcapitata]|eukprot:GBF99804.1 hypothetical protein Rsub_12557 [Raphidocelis subcapitata]